MAHRVVWDLAVLLSAGYLLLFLCY